MKKMLIIVFLILLFKTIGVVAISNGKLINRYILNEKSADGTEYWALLVGCNEFVNMPSATLPGNDICAQDFYKTLLASDHWYEDHIKLLTGKNASSINILKGLRWLDKMDDEDDVCLFYIATHGGPGPDYFPKDEDEGMDEWLTTYSTYEWYIPKLGGAITLPYLHRLSDDQINYMLSLLDAQGVCAIIDACYSGGFNDPPYDGTIAGYNHCNKYQKFTSQDFLQGFSEDIAKSGRVVIMSTKEDEITLTWYFAHCLMEGFQGFADIDEDRMISAEEAFEYASPKTTDWLYRKYKEIYEPQILDDYEGDLHLTDINLPPERSDFIGQKNSTVDSDCSFSISSRDPEKNHIHYYVNWGDNTEEWTSYVDSDEAINLHHSWKDAGTYNVWYNNEDDYGVVHSFGPILDRIVVMISDEEEKVDQQQTCFFDGYDVNDGVFSNRIWLSQSFVPSYSTLSRVDLLISTSSYNVGPITLSIRSNLTGEDFIEVSAVPPVVDNWFTELLRWTTFNLPNIDVVPDDTYYLIVHCKESDSLAAWMNVNSDCEFHPDYQNDPYENGMTFLSKNIGRTWIEYPNINDFCFVTYGR
ncbi:MAG: caspase family protein [Thermoplasmatales archaeon]|nr:MAG: caspase family protein [Thermoplasmatales archaeon]